ncbi:MAG: SDR family oxidoreductase [Ignavibacteriaceae bacterium]|jgi:NADP-dependent 3-hydroxy acid dehydrogenase YdfG|nr:MAG: SDR family oxidoreductase [Chlorobiota bacterium]KXK06044.1 MAG: dehydrogenase [Chlorobi bacterium OLB4]MBV6398479.1 Sepiapterin reductase [Ignavibacteria bacterium]MCC6885713.1 SDR family oxidoreductase [Ignavibacteriales bacterium]MCE7953092.1 SDR family oxidoreductase [Chlorobi bacterium CHB7]MDL1887070.1 SDR family oxidoreductase [Ignavibacteria bacterium CHB1]MEB2329125.1 SDR family oxidoreductase [Ignavibacteriaceae bacterium]OQY77963.1 MAG: hypothetical protein B6D43_05475 [Ig
MGNKKVIWLTGASTGIGLAIAKTTISKGYFVYATSRRADVIEGELMVCNGKYSALNCDVTEPESVNETYRTIISNSGKVDVLINNAGVTAFKSFTDTDLNDYNRIMDTNSRGTFLCSKAVIDGMKQRKSGMIINILSIAAISSLTESSVYSASKSAILTYSNVLREEVRKDRIKICNILPGATNTEMWAEEVREKFHDKMMNSESISDVVNYVLDAPDDIAIEEIIVKPVEGNI